MQTQFTDSDIVLLHWGYWQESREHDIILSSEPLLHGYMSKITT